MNAIRDIIDVKDKKITIDLPEDFHTNKVEVIVLPYTDDEAKQPTDNLSDFFRTSPLYDSGIQMERNKDTGRDLNL